MRDILKSQIDQLAERGNLALRRQTLRSALEAISQPVAHFSKFAAIGLALLLAALTLAGVLGVSAALAIGFGALVLAAVFWVGASLAQYLSSPPSRAESLAAFDLVLASEDRIQIADEFLASSRSSAFAEAAIEDAQPFVKAAMERDLGQPWLKGIRLPAFRKAAPVVAASYAFLFATLWYASGFSLSGVSAAEVAGVDPAISEAERAGAGLTGNDPAIFDRALRSEAGAETSGMESSASGEGSRGGQAGSPGGTAGQGQMAAGNSAPISAEKPATASVQAQAGPLSEPNAGASEVSSLAAALWGRVLAFASLSAPGMEAGDAEEGRPNRDPGAEAQRDARRNEPGSEEGEQSGGQEQGVPPLDQAGTAASAQSGDEGGEQGGAGAGGDDGVKRTRGASTLILSEPARDRLIGSENPGPVRRRADQRDPDGPITRAQNSQSRRSAGAPGDRLDRPASNPETQRLVREYFLRKRAGRSN